MCHRIRIHRCELLSDVCSAEAAQFSFQVGQSLSASLPSLCATTLSSVRDVMVSFILKLECVDFAFFETLLMRMWNWFAGRDCCQYRQKPHCSRWIWPSCQYCPHQFIIHSGWPANLAVTDSRQYRLLHRDRMVLSRLEAYPNTTVLCPSQGK